MATGANTRTTSRTFPIRHDSTSQNKAMGRPICGLINKKNSPICGGRITPNAVKPVLFVLTISEITHADVRTTTTAQPLPPRFRTTARMQTTLMIESSASTIHGGNHISGITGMSAHGGL
jgi:hypothetical protein